MPPNRLVAVFTPLIAVAAGGAATWLADRGLNVSAADMEAVFVAVALAVLAPAGQWLYGSQKYEQHEAALERQALAADTQAADAATEAEMHVAAAYYDEDDDEDEYEYEYGPESEDEGDDYDDAARDEQPAPAA